MRADALRAKVDPDREDRERRRYLDEGENVHVLEWGWNDHMSYVSTTTTARHILQIRLEQRLHFVEDPKFEGARPWSTTTPTSGRTRLTRRSWRSHRRHGPIVERTVNAA